MNGAGIAFRYALFAALAMAANLGAQALVVRLFPGPHGLTPSILAGTAVGLPVKYLLDKHFIFCYTTRSLSHNGRLFVLYSFTGVFTTLLFWAVEYAFQGLFGGTLARMLGGALGLSFGYYLKYQLDRRFVFSLGLPGPAGGQ